MSRFDLPEIYQTIYSSDLYFSYEDPRSCKPSINWSAFIHLQISKDKIEYHSDKWDTKRRLTNPYEFIHTPPPNSSTPVCKLQPLSRAYFKMIEIIHEYGINKMPMFVSSTPIKTYHLAEGPGGFIESIVNLRRNPSDQYYGMTLLDDTPATPGWKKAAVFLKRNPNVIIEYGEDGTGNLLMPKNLLKNYREHAESADIITADGGFDFSVDYGKQELTASWLIFAQICHAILIQKPGGVFIIKMFDLFHNVSIEFLYMLSIYYESVSIFKPLTSREANSEKYIVCRGFRNQFAHLINKDMLVSKMIAALQYGIDSKYAMVPNQLLLRRPPLFYINAIEEANIMLAQRQIHNIENTLNVILLSYSTTSYHGSHTYNHKFELIKRQNIQKCIQWCIRHGLPYYSMSMFHSGSSGTHTTFKYRPAPPDRRIYIVDSRGDTASSSVPDVLDVSSIMTGNSDDIGAGVGAEVGAETEDVAEAAATAV